MRFLKRLMTCAMACAFVLSTTILTGCSALNPTSVEDAQKTQAQSKQTQLTTPTIQESGYLTVGLLNSETVPLVLEDGAELSGIDIDLASALADELGLKVRFVEVDSTEAATDGTCDIVMGAELEDADATSGATSTDASADTTDAGDTATGDTATADTTTTSSTSNVSVMGAYAERAVAVLYSGTQEPLNISELANKTIGLQAASASQRLLEQTGLSVTEQTFSNLNEAVSALNDGSIDFVVCDAYAGAYLTGAYSGTHVGGTLEAPTPLGIAVAATNTQLEMAITNAMSSISSNGVYTLIRSRWVGDLPTLTSESELAGTQELISANTQQATDQTATETDGATSNG